MGRPASASGDLPLSYMNDDERTHFILHALESGGDLDALAAAVLGLGPAGSVMATLDALAEARVRSRPDLERQVAALDAAVRRLEEAEHG